MVVRTSALTKSSVFTQSDRLIDPAAMSLRRTTSLPDLESLLKNLVGDVYEQTSHSNNGDLTDKSSVRLSSSENTTTDGAPDMHHSIRDFREEQPNLLQGRVSPDENFDMDIFVDYSPPMETLRTGLEHDGQERSSCNTDTSVHQTQQSTKKRKSRPGVSSEGRKKPLATKDDALNRYILDETEKCKAMGHSLPHNTFLTQTTQRAALKFGTGKAKTVLKILAHIASTQSIAGLQKLLTGLRDGTIETPVHHNGPMSITDRFTLICSFTAVISLYQLLRRYHVLELFRECRGSAMPSCSGSILITPHNFDSVPKRPGNPKNMSEALVTANMMEQVFPSISIRSDNYESNFRRMKLLRKLGQRLDKFAIRFGEGILGLIPDHGFTGQSDADISDNMYVHKFKASK